MGQECIGGISAAAAYVLDNSLHQDRALFIRERRFHVRRLHSAQGVGRGFLFDRHLVVLPPHVNEMRICLRARCRVASVEREQISFAFYRRLMRASQNQNTMGAFEGVICPLQTEAEWRGSCSASLFAA
jgi:hypothetical protein